MTGRRPNPPQMPRDVARAFDAFPTGVRQRLLQVPGLIFETAARTDGVGPLAETLKWSEPAYITEATGSGTTIRLGRLRSSDETCAVLFNCRTTLVETFREQFSGVFAYEKNRAILLRTSGALPKAPLSICLAMALTYHRRKTAV
jgi:hypothetical protein